MKSQKFQLVSILKAGSGIAPGQWICSLKNYLNLEVKYLHSKTLSLVTLAQVESPFKIS